MITPSAPPSGATIWAVTEWDLFFILMMVFSLNRPMPLKKAATSR